MIMSISQHSASKKINKIIIAICGGGQYCGLESNFVEDTKMTITQKDIMAAAVHLGASPYTMVHWKTRRALSAKWLVKLAKHFATSIEAVEEAWTK